MLAQVADRTCDLWRERDSGMWELPELEHYTSSKMGCWQALRDAVRLAEAGAIPGDTARWASERDRISTWIARECWSEDAGAYTMYPGSTALDDGSIDHVMGDSDQDWLLLELQSDVASDLGGDEIGTDL